MENIRIWAQLLIFISIACLIYYYLLPSGNISQTAKAVMSAVVLAALCVPLLGGVQNLSFNFSEEGAGNSENISSYMDYYIETAKRKTAEVIDEIVKKHTETDYKIEIDINIGEDNCINIEQARLIFEDEIQSSGELKRNIRIETGIEAQISVEKSNE